MNDWKSWLKETTKHINLPELPTDADELRDSLKGARDYVKHKAYDLNESRKDWQKHTTSVMGDDLRLFRSSDNPLVRLSDHKLPDHVLSAFVFLGAAAGVYSNRQEMMRFTREIMDHDDGALQKVVRAVFESDNAREISMWMDQVPGTDFYGGMGHRLYHGHDVSALLDLMRSYPNHEAFIEWFNHVWLRDFWTPQGVPYLPAGTGTAHEWLMAQGMSFTDAMSLLTINAAEAASGLLILGSSIRAKNAFSKYRAKRSFDKEILQIITHTEKEQHHQALKYLRALKLKSCYQEHFQGRLQLATLCLTQSHQSQRQQSDHKISIEWANQAFDIAKSMYQGEGDPQRLTAYHGGTVVSEVGLAGVILTSTFADHLRVSRTDAVELAEHLDISVDTFIACSANQIEPNIQQATYRPYSALTNQLLALQISSAAYNTGLPIKSSPLAIRELMEKSLRRLVQDKEPHSTYAFELKENLMEQYPLNA